MSEGIKYDKEKLRWDLVPYKSFEEIVRVISFGAKKYSPNNWKELDEPKDRYFSALMRHLTAWKNGEQLDQETGINHLAHAGCNILFLLWFDGIKEAVYQVKGKKK